MKAPLLELDGTWEEIAAHATEFAGRRVRLAVLESEPDSHDAIDLRAHGIERAQAAELRDQLASFAADWDAPEMDIYDNYDAAKRSR